MRMSRLFAVFTVALVTVGVATAHAAKPELTDETSADGLVKVKHAKFGLVWVRPDLDLTPYTKVMLEGVGIEYRPAKKASMNASRSGQTDFAMTDQQKASLREIMSEAFRKELGKSKEFQIVEQPGPDTLRLRGALIDVVSHVPPEPTGRGDVYLRSIGEATLVIEMRDSESEQILVRAADRMAAEQQGMIQPSSRVTNAYEVRHVATMWARMLRQGLENTRALGAQATAQ